MSPIPQHDEESGSTSPSPKPVTNDYIVGICIFLLVALLWTLANFATKYTFQDGYQKPAMVTYLNMVLYIVPVCLKRLYHMGSISQNRDLGPGYEQLARDLSERHPLAVRLLHAEVDDRLTLKETSKLALYACFLWFCSNWALHAALAYTSVASVAILTGVSGMFTLIIGSIFRVETLTLSKIGAVLIGFGGIILVSCSDSSSIDLTAALGDTLALLSALSYAIYSTFLKVQIKEESRIDMELFVGFMGLFVIFLYWPVALVFDWLAIEPLKFPGSMQLLVVILINMCITALADYLNVIATLKTTPLVAAIGPSLTIPIAVTGDYFLGKAATLQVLSGAILITAAFIAIGIENSKQRQPIAISSGSTSQ